MGSIDTGDEGRDGHLRTNDFFDVEQFPTMTFTSTKLTGSGSEFEVTGDLTIKGVTRPVTFDLEVGGVQQDPWGNTKAGFTLTGSINRKDFGMEYNAVLESGGVLVGDKVTIEIDVEAALQKEELTVNVTGLNHAVLWVRDAQASAAFYTEALGFTVVDGDPAGRAVFLRAGASSNHHDLGLFTRRRPPVAAAPLAGAVPPGVAGRHDRGPRRRRRGVLRERGALVGATDHGVSKSLYAKDPDGIEFEVMWQVPPDAWSSDHAGLEPLDLAAELARWAGVSTGS